MLEVRGWDEHVFRSNYALQRVVAFDSEKFNFPQVDLAKELVFQSRHGEDIWIINVSPIEFGHCTCLFIPSRRFFIFAL